MENNEKDTDKNDMIDKRNFNIYQKIQKVKLELSKRNLKKTGQNTFSHFEYYQLEDILPSIIELCEKYHLFTKTTFTNEEAILEIIDSDNDGKNPDLWKQVYTSPMKDAEIKGANAIQCLGGTETYQRRYLYMTAFDITEGDMFDENINKGNKNKGNKKIDDELIEKANKCKAYFASASPDKQKEMGIFLLGLGVKTLGELNDINVIEKFAEKFEINLTNNKK